MKIKSLDFFNNITVNQTFIALDMDGNLIIEGFKKMIDYSCEKIQLIANSKMLYVYGEKIVILSCTKHTATIKGKISKIEIFEVGNV